MKPGIGIRLFFLLGEFAPQAREIQDDGPWLSDAEKNDPAFHGRYLALTVCAECHGMDLRGFGDFAPSLAAVVAYSIEDFTRLMREGIALGDRELDLMAEMAQRRFAHLTDAEIVSLYSYLGTLASETTSQ